MNGRLTAKGAELNQLQERRRESRQKTILTIIGFTTQNNDQHIKFLSIGHYFSPIISFLPCLILYLRILF